MKTPEGTTKDDIKDVLKEYGDELYAFWPVSGYGRGSRTVDCLICFRGQFIAVEAKRKGARARKFQERILDKIREANGHAICIDSAVELKDTLDYIAKCEVKLVARSAT